MSQQISLRGVRGNPSPGRRWPAAPVPPDLGTARDGAGDGRGQGDTVVRVGSDNGFVPWSRDGRPVAAISARHRPRWRRQWEISRLAPRRTAANERGPGWLAACILDFFWHRPRREIGSPPSAGISSKSVGGAPTPVLPAVQSGRRIRPAAGPTMRPSRPMPAFPVVSARHRPSGRRQLRQPGMAVTSKAPRLRQEPATAIYGNRVFALEHRTLTESPIDMRWPWPSACRAGADVHLVSHCAAVVGEGCSAWPIAPIRHHRSAPKRCYTLFAADRTLARNSACCRSSDADEGARRAAYDADRKTCSNWSTCCSRSSCASAACPRRLPGTRHDAGFRAPRSLAVGA